MRRWPTLLLLLFLGQCLSGSTPGTPSPVSAQQMTIFSEPVLLDSSNPLRHRIGPLTFLGGWHLTSDVRSFGGLSTLDVDGGDFTSISDVGAIVRFHFGRFGHASRASIAPVPRGCGDVHEKTDNDTESAAHDPSRTHWWIGFEWRNVICRTNGDLSVGQAVSHPVDMAGWGKKRGAESLVRLHDGRFLAIEEGYPGTRPRDVLVFSGDPAQPGTAVTRLGYVPPDGYSPTDAAELPDGRLLILNRHFSVWTLFRAKLVLVDPGPLAAGQVLRGQEIADFRPPVIADNFEGIATAQEDGRTILWIASDDNFMRWQRTLLLKFALD